MYEEITDNELLDKVSDNELATEALFEKYRPLITGIAKKIYYSSKVSGVEIADLIQEGMVGFSIAINTYNDKEDASFYTFARMCIIRRILSSITAANTKKHQILNESISVESISEDPSTKENIFSDYDSNPEKLLIIGENTKELIRDIEKELTNLECEVFELKTAGFNYKEIAEILEKDPKSVDNAISRIKTKINKYLKEKE
ncbi:MAG: sigma-70 family RNA polymerase sigma factor [Bacilli bacterium]|nr:sigma-70 family RNA polymerase sigma factor [Bacilli bacterium]